jgi:hypothetical protein
LDDGDGKWSFCIPHLTGTYTITSRCL